MLGSPRRTRRSVAVALATAACAAAALGTVAASASAATCPSTYACGWINSNFGSNRGQWAGTNPHFSAFGQPNCQDGNWNDCVSSDANSGTSCTVHFWTDSSYQGTRHNVARGNFESSLGGLNDEFSSNNWC
jgi:Peptidase inhibitor family I36